jgi:RNAse (barnase) inhibitor barstar
MITWPAVPAKAYQVQYKTDLADAFWTVLSGNVTLLGTQASFTDFSVSTQRYYRVVAL